jgi:hypothetical protein
MNFGKIINIKEFWTNSLQKFGRAWWIEITTGVPRCVYYFGPFSTSKEAESAQFGYIEDLENEGAIDIKVVVKQCKPLRLTIADDLGEIFDRSINGYLSGQY